MNTRTVEAQKNNRMLNIQDIQAIVDAIAERFSPEKIILFGSYASGHPTPDSDVDLLVIMNTQEPRHRRAVPMRLLFRPVPFAMDILVFTPDEVAYWNGTVNHILTEAIASGKVLYERAA
jgi:predicted nucleotidyltransferase